MAWLLGIAKRCVDGRGQRIELSSESIEERRTGDLEEETIRRLTVTGAVARLDERDRELIALRYGADMTARQIAELLGARTNAIEVALHRALGRLRAGFDDEDELASVRKREASR